MFRRSWLGVIMGFSVFIIIVFSCYMYVRPRIPFSSAMEPIDLARRSLYANEVALLLTCLTIVMAYVIFETQKAQSKELASSSKYGTKIDYVGLNTKLEELIQKKKLDKIIFISNYSQVPGFWLDKKVRNRFKELINLSLSNNIDIDLRGPSDIAAIYDQMDIPFWMKREKSWLVNRHRIINEYKRDIAYLDQLASTLRGNPHGSFSRSHRRISDLELGVNALMVCKRNSPNIDNSLYEIMYFVPRSKGRFMGLPTTILPDIPKPLLPIEIRHASDEATYRLCQAYLQYSAA